MQQSYADRTNEAFRVSRDPITYEVDVSSEITLEDYKPLIPASDWEFLEKWAAPLKGKSIVFVNPTMAGGGVAMLRPPLVHMMRLFGIEAHWFVMQGKFRPKDYDPFLVTKLMHNIAQRRVDDRLSEKGKKIHQKWCRKNAEVLTQQPEIQNADIIMLDDPQPAPLKKYFEAVNPDVKFVWRNHIDTSHTLMAEPGTPQAEIAEYVMDECGIRDVEAVVAHPVIEFMHPGMESKTFFAPATIEPFDDLNRELMPDEIQEGINFINMSIDELNASSIMVDSEDVMPYIDERKQRLCLIARFDESKGMGNALELGARTRKQLRSQGVAEDALPQIIVVGNGSIDDPSGVPIFEALLKLRREKYADEKDGMVVMRLPHNYVAMNALMYSIPISENVVGGPSIIGMQMSFAEGMETRITDWISHGVPVIISNCGGMFLQVKEGKSGIVLDYNKDDYDLTRGVAFAAKLFSEPNMYSDYTASTLQTSKNYNEREFTTTANATRLFRVFAKVFQDAPADTKWKLTEDFE